MKSYGITYPDGSREIFTNEKCEGAANARVAFATLRGALCDGETIALWSLSETGLRSTLATVFQPRIYDSLVAASLELPN